MELAAITTSDSFVESSGHCESNDEESPVGEDPHAEIPNSRKVNNTGKRTL
jgi:hypothetical protein